MSFQDVVDSYLRQPSPQTWAPLKRAILLDRTYDPAPTTVALANAQLSQGQHFEALRILDRAMPGLFFSPSAHMAQRRALADGGRSEAAERALLFARAAYRTIADSGDGSAERPWKVLRISDQYDFLDLESLTSTGQSQEDVDGRRLDAHRLADGPVVYFELEVAS